MGREKNVTVIEIVGMRCIDRPEGGPGAHRAVQLAEGREGGASERTETGFSGYEGLCRLVKERPRYVAEVGSAE